jgi:hypothetical protein
MPNGTEDDFTINVNLRGEKFAMYWSLFTSKFQINNYNISLRQILLNSLRNFFSHSRQFL